MSPNDGRGDTVTRRHGDVSDALAASPRHPLGASNEAADDARDATNTEAIWQALREVMDPEFPISLVDLGLIYDVRRNDREIEIDLTFTATACPCMAFIREDITERVLKEPGVASVKINEVWDPPWTRERMSEEGKAVLRRAGVAA